MSDEFPVTLFCWIFGNDPCGFFRIRINASETVDKLKDAIKDENPCKFRDIDAQTIQLRKSNIDLNNLNKSFFKLDDLENPELNPLKCISDYWPSDPADRALHVIVLPSYMALIERRALKNCTRQEYEYHHAPMHQILEPISPSPTTSKIGALYLGSISAFVDPSYLSTHEITHIVHVIDEPFFPDLDEGHPFTCYKIDLEDNPWVDLTPHLKGVCDFIDGALQSGGNVLVHCYMGVSRSASVVIAYLMRSKNMTYDAAHALVLSKRGIRPNEGFERCLRRWEIQNQE